MPRWLDRFLSFLLLLAAVAFALHSFPRGAQAFTSVPVPVISGCPSLDLILSRLEPGLHTRVYQGFQAQALARQYAEEFAPLPGVDTVIVVSSAQESRAIFAQGGHSCVELRASRSDMDGFIRAAGIGDA